MAKSFEDALTELEEIVSKLENGDATLDESIKLFENGMKLTKTCRKQLENAQKKVTMLMADENGEINEVPFDTADEQEVK